MISLLKNEDDVLPLKGIRRIGVFGTDAGAPSTLSGCGTDLFCTIASERRYWNGTVTIGGGSGAAYPDYIVSPQDRRLSRPNLRLCVSLHPSKLFPSAHGLNVSESITTYMTTQRTLARSSQ